MNCVFDNSISLAGTDKIADDVMMMLGRRPPVFMTICWKFVTPTVLAVSGGFYF